MTTGYQNNTFTVYSSLSFPFVVYRVSISTTGQTLGHIGKELVFILNNAHLEIATFMHKETTPPVVVVVVRTFYIVL